jgi:hypothetical protein
VALARIGAVRARVLESAFDFFNLYSYSISLQPFTILGMATEVVTESNRFERCRNCSAELSPEREVCPACGTVASRSPTNTPSKP